MSINVNDKNIGHATAYAYYKAGGGTMTEAEFTEFMADFGTASQTAVEAAQAALASKNAAQTAATTATTKASEATTAAQTATTKAGEASTSASTATSAKDTAVSASQTATTKASEATTAAATATNAASTATTAKDDAVSAKTAAQTAQTGAETAAASVSASAAQIATNTSDINELKEDLTTKANIDGSYEDLVSGGAYQIISNMEEVDNTPYGYRTAGGSLEIGDREKLKKIVGGTINWNQLVRDPLFEEYSTGKWAKAGIDTFSVSNGVLSITPNGSSSRIGALYGVNKKGHKYFMSAFYNGTEGDAVLGWYGAGIKTTPLIGRWQYVAVVFNSTYNDNDNWQYDFQVGNNQNFASYQIMYPKVCDLTQMFGATIADYVYGLETATAGSGVAWLKSHFPRIFNAGYVPYNAGELVSVSGLSEHKMVGFNQWDEVAEAGNINTTGENGNNTTYLRSKNYIPVLPNTVYYRKSPANILQFYYDADKNFISYGSWEKNATITTPANCHFMRFETDPAYGATYNHDICINLHWGGERDGEYEPYEEHSYSLDSDVTLRGIPKLDANNSLYYDGDEYVADGTVTRKYGIVDLGTLNWAYDSAKAFFYSTAIADALAVTYTSLANCITAKYLTVKGTSYNGGIDKTVSINDIYGDRRVGIKDSAYTDAATFKAAMSGVYLVYELATPTTEEADPYTEIQNVSNWGTEEFVTTSLVPVGHETAYQPDLRAKIEVAPESPDTDGYYLMKRENGENAYVAYLGELPSDPTTDGTYTLKCTVASGTATKTWEADT